MKLPDEIVQALIARRESSPNDPPLDIDFGDRPGIHIGDHFFPTEFAREQKSHEIFTMASNKAQAPLRHYASVEGKILVKRVLNDKISDRVKKSNEASVKKAKARPIQLLDAPPAKGKAAAKATKKKSVTTKVTTLHVRNASLPSNSTPSVTPVRNGSTSTTPARVHSPLPSSNPKPALIEAQSLMRYRLIHFLALTPKTSAEVIRNIGGSTCDLNTRSQISTCLSQVATEDPPPRRSDPNPQPRLWRLKTESWFDVRPYEYPSLSDEEREKIARQAQHILKEMNVSETDPRWEHIKHRTLSGSAISQGSNQSVPSGTSKIAKAQLDISRDVSPLPATSARRKVPSAQSTTPQAKPSGSRPSHSKVTAKDPVLPNPESRTKSIPPTRPVDTVPTSRDDTSKLGTDRSKRKRDREQDLEDELLKTSEIKRRKSDEETNVSSLRATSKMTNGSRPNSSAPTPSGSKPVKRPITPSMANKTVKTSSRSSRHTPIYTSSSESEDEPPSKKPLNSKTALTPASIKRGPSPRLSPRPTNGHVKPLPYSMPKVAFGGTLPKDRVSLRKRYNTIYPSYISVYQKCVEQRMAIEKLLEDTPPAEEGEVEEELMVASDIEMLDASDLKRLNTDFLKLENELGRINTALRSAPS